MAMCSPGTSPPFSHHHVLPMEGDISQRLPLRPTPEDLETIREEEENLKRLIELAPKQRFIANREEILDQIFRLRETLNEANKDDIPQLMAQLDRLTALANRGDRSGGVGVDLRNPYFAHMRLQEKGLTRDIYLGTQVYQSPDGRIQIVDWRSSPIAVVYFRYGIGEEYDEEIGGRTFEGRVAVKRILKVTEGRLVKIQQENLLLILDANLGWRRADVRYVALRGGSGTAVRPGHTRTATPKLGVAPLEIGAGRKYLPEITALIDSDQFETITQPKTGIVAIQGTAGSGKTTVALHRVAWLHFQDPIRFQPEEMMVLVFNRALANYISQVLPSLGIRGVAIDFFENWISGIRRGIYGSLLPNRYSERTPVVVVRFKKHPALLAIVKDFIEGKRALFFRQLKKVVADRKIDDFPFVELKSLPFVECLYTLSGWLTDRVRFLDRPFSYGGKLQNSVQRLLVEFVDMERSRKEMALQFWEDLFLDFALLKKRFKRLAPREFTAAEYNEIVAWLKYQYVLREAKRKTGDLSRGDVSEKATLDAEDDPILVLFYQFLVGSGIGGKKRVPQYAHLMIDEAQDLCPIELKVLLNVCRKPPSLTLAGDVNQQLIQHSGFDDWDAIFRHLGVEGQRMSVLRVNYRSTHEIMEFSLAVLGELATTKDFVATRHGPAVELFGFSGQGELTYRLANHVRELMQTEPNASIAVICIDSKEASRYYELLCKVDIPKLRLIRDQEFSFTAGIDLTDVKQVKGLEFDYVVLLDVDTANYPDLPYSRYLLHIGATRAAHQLWIMNHRVHAPILPKSLLRRQIV